MSCDSSDIMNVFTKYQHTILLEGAVYNFTSLLVMAIGRDVFWYFEYLTNVKMDKLIVITL